MLNYYQTDPQPWNRKPGLHFPLKNILKPNFPHIDAPFVKRLEANKQSIA